MKRRSEVDLLSVVNRYGTNEECRAYLAELRWPDGVTCPACQSNKISRIVKRNQYDCDSCRYQFSDHGQTQRIGIFTGRPGRGIRQESTVRQAPTRRCSGAETKGLPSLRDLVPPYGERWSGYIIRETSHLGMPLPAAPFRAAADRWPGARSVATRPSDAENASPLGDFHRFCSRRGNSRVPRENRARPRCGRRRFPEIRETHCTKNRGSLVLLGRRFFIHICIWE